MSIGLWASDQSAAITPLLPANLPLKRLGGSAAVAMHGFGRPDVLHDNGIWLPHNHRLAELGRNASRLVRVVSIPGYAGAVGAQPSEKLKKKAGLVALSAPGFVLGPLIIHATADAEAEGCGICRARRSRRLIPNGIDLAQIVGPSGDVRP